MLNHSIIFNFICNINKAADPVDSCRSLQTKLRHELNNLPASEILWSGESQQSMTCLLPPKSLSLIHSAQVRNVMEYSPYPLMNSSLILFTNIWKHMGSDKIKILFKKKINCAKQLQKLEKQIDHYLAYLSPSSLILATYCVNNSPSLQFYLLPCCNFCYFL